MIYTPVSAAEESILWERLADWIARHDRSIPLWHRLCVRLWTWALYHAARAERR